MRKQYSDQMFKAKQRGIDWHFTYDEWVKWWGDDITNRGIGSNDLQMCRKNDTGPYHPNNVYKATTKQNRADQDDKKPLIYNGKKYATLTELANALGRHGANVRKSIKQGTLKVEYVCI